MEWRPGTFLPGIDITPPLLDRILGHPTEPVFFRKIAQIIIIIKTATEHYLQHKSLCINASYFICAYKKAKQSRYTPYWCVGREEIQLLLILYLGTRLG
jgi:hypothetical protein